MKHQRLEKLTAAEKALQREMKYGATSATVLDGDGYVATVSVATVGVKNKKGPAFNYSFAEDVEKERNGG